MKYILCITACLYASSAFAQSYSSPSMREAVYLATLKAVLDYKMDDSKNLEKLETLRQDERFNEKLKKMLTKLNNDKPKPAVDQRVYQMLIQSGQNIYNDLN